MRTPKLDARLFELFEKGLGPHPAHRAVADKMSYGTAYAIYREWKEKRESATGVVIPSQPAEQAELALSSADEQPPGADAAPKSVELPGATGEEPTSEPPLEAMTATGNAIVQHVGSWILLGLLERLEFYESAWELGTKVARWPLRTAIDAAAIALALGQECIEGVRRLSTTSVGLLLRHPGGISASWVRRVLHEFADDTNDADDTSKAGKTFPEAIAKKLLVRAGEGEERILLYVDNHLRPYTGKHTVRKGWRMQSKRAVPGTTEYYAHDEEGCPLFRLDTTSHDSLCDWLMPVVDFAHLALGDEVKPLLFFDRGGAFPEVMAELRKADAEFATYERKPYPELGATEFKESLEILLASKPKEPIRIAYTEAPNKNLREGRGRVRRIALLTEDGAQINILAVSTLPAEMLIRGLLARWGRQENQFKHEVERWGINHLDGRRVEQYPPDAIIPNPERRKLDRLLKLSHTAEGEGWRKWGRLVRHVSMMSGARNRGTVLPISELPDSSAGSGRSSHGALSSILHRRADPSSCLRDALAADRGGAGGRMRALPDV